MLGTGALLTGDCEDLNDDVAPADSADYLKSIFVRGTVFSYAAVQWSFDVARASCERIYDERLICGCSISWKPSCQRLLSMLS